MTIGTKVSVFGLWRTGAAVSFAIGLALCGCGGDEPRGGTFDSAVRRDGGGGRDGGALPESSAVHVLTTISAGEIDLATLALGRATNADVRDFASTMITEHTAAQSMVDAWARANATNPTDNPVSMMIEAEATESRRTLLALSAGAFDEAYMSSQVTMHRDALQIIDTRLMPGTDDQELRTLLRSIRRDVAEHLLRALAVQDDLTEG